MKNTRNELKLNKLQYVLFDITFSILFFHNILVSFSTVPMPIVVQIIMLIIAFIAFILFIAMQKISLKTIIQTILFVALSGISYYFTKKMDLLYISFMLFFLSYIDEKSFLKVDLRNRIIIVLSLFVLAKTGIIEDKNGLATGNAIFQNTSIRYSCGFRNPNTFGFSLVLISIEATLLMRHAKQKKILEMLGVILLAILLVFLFSGTKTAIIILLIELLLVFVPRKMNSIKPKRIKIYYFLFPLFTLVTFVLCVLYKSGSSFGYFVNKLITGRIALLCEISNKFSLSLFGNTIIYASSHESVAQKIGAVICDNVYYYQLYNFGIVGWLIWSFLSFITFKYLRNKNDKFAILCFVLILIAGLVENTMSVVFFMPFILYYAHALKALLRGEFENEQ